MEGGLNFHSTLPFLFLIFSFKARVCLNEGGLGLESDCSRFSAPNKKWEDDEWFLATNLLKIFLI
jgi:hypothetical protein